MLSDDLLEHVPDNGTLTLDHALGGLDVLSVVEVDQPLHDERLEELQRHLLGQAALVQLQLRADHDDRTAGVVDALAEQVLAEPALLALEHVRQRLQRPVARTGDRTATTAVVEQCVDGLLQHPLFVVDDDLGGTEVEQSLQPVVAVDDPSVQVVEVAGREPATVELHHGTQVRRDHRYGVEHHAHRAVACVQEGRHDLEPLQGAGLLLPLAGGDDLAQPLGLGSEVEALQPIFDRLGAHAAAEVDAEAVTHLAVEQLVTLEVLDLEVLEPLPHVGEAVDLGVGALADLRHLALGRLAHLAPHVALGALGLQRGEVAFELLLASLDVAVALALDLVALDADLRLDRGKVAMTPVLVDPGDHVGREVDDLLEVLRCQVEQVAQPARDALEVPDVGDRRGQLDVPHALPANLGARDLDAAAFTDDALEAHPLVLAAVALPVASRSEDLLAEEPVLLRLQGAVVDGLRLLDLTVGPLTDVLGGGQTDTQVVEVVDVEQGVSFT